MWEPQILQVLKDGRALLTRNLLTYNSRKIAETLNICNVDLLEEVMRVYYSIICEYHFNVTAEFCWNRELSDKEKRLFIFLLNLKILCNRRQQK
jgi:hypothetical protein